MNSISNLHCSHSICFAVELSQSNSSAESSMTARFWFGPPPLHISHETNDFARPNVGLMICLIYHKAFRMKRRLLAAIAARHVISLLSPAQLDAHTDRSSIVLPTAQPFGRSTRR